MVGGQEQTQRLLQSIRSFGSHGGRESSSAAGSGALLRCVEVALDLVSREDDAEIGTLAIWTGTDEMDAAVLKTAG